MVSLLQKLEDLGEFVSSREPRVNSGGCCVFAACVGSRLASLGIPSWGVVADSSTKVDIATARRNGNTNGRRLSTPTDWYSVGVGFNHVLLQFAYEDAVWTYDAEHLVQGTPHQDPTLGNPIVPGYLTIAELRRLAATPVGWNSMFPRETGIPLIRRAVKKYLPTVFLSR